MSHDARQTRTGGCQCGAVRYRIDREPVRCYACHCRECQKQSASAFGISVIVPRSGFALTAGAPRRWSRPTDSGGTLDCWFCPTCGSRLWHETEPNAETLSIKGGSLDEPVDFDQLYHIWTARKLEGLQLPAGCKSHPGEPPD
ncbi:MAG: GFA family protein [Hyphomicrobiaceae bacterium]